MPSTIEWTDETWNPVTGCTRVSPGCDNCYMFALYPRLRAMGVRGYESEPLLGPVDLSEWLDAGDLHWVITGGESGRAARPMDLDWARSLRDQCARANVPFFLKQLGGRRGKRSGDQAVMDGRVWREAPPLILPNCGWSDNLSETKHNRRINMERAAGVD